MPNAKEQVALGSIFASAGLTIAKGVVGVLSGSLALLSEAGHSLLDFVATIITYVAVRISGKPADDEHHYGHGKVESIAALAATALLFVLSGVVIWEAGKRLFGAVGHDVDATPAAFAVIIVSILVDFWRARLLYRVAGETASEALEADALHFGSDMWSSIAVLIGLGAVAAGFKWADAAAALVVAVFVCLAGWRLARRTLHTLTDTAPEGAAQQLTRIAGRISGVVAVERVRVRPAGDKLFVEITAAVSRTLPLERVVGLKEQIAAAIHAEMPRADLNIIAEPRALDDETVLERVMVIARNRALAVHHVSAHHVEGRLAVSLDLEVDAALTLGAAHEIATGLEEALRDELGSDVEIETHIEPLQPHDAPGRDASAERVTEIERSLIAISAEMDFVGEVHDVRVRQTDEGEIVNFHCGVDPGLSVHDAHERVDDLERALRRRFPTIKRVIGHAEPEMPNALSSDTITGGKATSG
ncbi:MAG TPA: cation-efflux pump [Xanthobacteraceae bacterium]|jgi:cation diffusion facilitator family transporter